MKFNNMLKLFKFKYFIKIFIEFNNMITKSKIINKMCLGSRATRFNRKLLEQ